MLYLLLFFSLNTNYSLILFLHLVKIGVRTVGIEDFVAIHDGYEVLGVGEVDDVVGVAREHDDRLDVVATYLIVENLSIRVGFVSQLNESVTADYSKVFKL